MKRDSIQFFHFFPLSFQDVVRQNSLEEENLPASAISPRILSEFEKGSGNPTLATLEKIASPFGLEVTFLPPQSWRMRPDVQHRGAGFED
ncbi:MAG: helix-turn-helix domain-containing protein [Deltaproteobacteria bacterium]|nr:helix-turn-helix domain-containing protein [Deltaproteobacteria bacterium]